MESWAAVYRKILIQKARFVTYTPKTRLLRWSVPVFCPNVKPAEIFVLAKRMFQWGAGINRQCLHHKPEVGLVCLFQVDLNMKALVVSIETFFFSFLLKMRFITISQDIRIILERTMLVLFSFLSFHKFPHKKTWLFVSVVYKLFCLIYTPCFSLINWKKNS